MIMGTLENIFVAFLLPVCICVLLPVLIMWLVSRIEMNRNNRRADVLIEAIKTYNGMDVDRLSEALVKPRRTPLEMLNLRLLRGCIFSLTGIAFMVVCIVTYFNCDRVMTDVAGVFMVLGAVSIAIGISYLITYFVTKKQL